MEGQITLDEYLKSIEKPKICNFSQHTCNKVELWKIAHTFDDFVCPEVCCRACDIRLCGARCNGSEEPDKVYQLDIRGLCDDPYCPKCGYAFITYGSKNETDSKCCPKCGIKVDWTHWHRMNDEEEECLQTKN